ncbi:MAG TPA: PilN domain-containing protein [Terriglobales bacterium]|jgi:type IV pilus assembly protein PilN|nr:PilN domain-containing protein [Terriglobales bacterium]
MIRINLLGSPKPKGKKSSGPALTMPSFELGNLGGPIVQVAAVLLIAGALNYGYWYQLDREKKSIDVQSRMAEQKNRELADIKVRYLERQKQADSYKRRVDVIDQLRASQTGPLNLLAMIGDTINGTEAVWLNTLQDQGASVAIDGTALSSDAVANLISNLQKTGYFKNIEIKESFQDESVKDMQAFQFTLTCEKAKS